MLNILPVVGLGDNRISTVHSTRFTHPSPAGIFRHPSRLATQGLVCLYAAGRRCSVYLVDHVQSVACPADAVRIGDPESAVLYFHGEFDAAMAAAVESDVGVDSESRDRGKNFGGAR